jgi:predicted branched-subunit amino acid permease
MKPQTLFGMDGLDPLVHAIYWSLSANVGLLVGVSLFTHRAPLERLQSALFVDVFRNPVQHESRALVRTAAIDDLFVLAQRILGADWACPATCPGRMRPLSAHWSDSSLALSVPRLPG